MPVITIEGPKIESLETKRELVSKVTRFAAKAYDMPPRKIIVVLKETTPDNVAVGGKLVIDTKKED